MPWETEGAMRASEEAAKQPRLRSEAADTARESIAEMDRYEVIVGEVKRCNSSSRIGPALRVLHPPGLRARKEYISGSFGVPSGRR